jgi:Icc-related predicted phosphoesterase
MKIVCIADTHNREDDLIIPDGDIIIHAGDLTEGGTKREVTQFINWFSSLPHSHKIFIAGNHDYYLEDIDKETFAKSLPKGVHYLHNTALSLGNIKFWGTPQVPSLTRWAFKEPFYWNDIPKDTDILISHVPPYEILDLHDRNFHLGDKVLAKRVDKLSLSYHIFGHVHDAYGLTRIKNTIFVNASSVDSTGRYFNPPIILDVSSKDLLE